MGCVQRERAIGPKRVEQRGIALATSLLLGVLMLVLGMCLLTTSQVDLSFQRQQLARDKADALARSGVEHCLFLLNQTPPALELTVNPLNNPVEYKVYGNTEVFVLERRRDSSSGAECLVVKGLVRKTKGEEVARRTLIVPYGPDTVLTQTDFTTGIFSREF